MRLDPSWLFSDVICGHRGMVNLLKVARGVYVVLRVLFLRSVRPSQPASVVALESGAFAIDRQAATTNASVHGGTGAAANREIPLPSGGSRHTLALDCECVLSTELVSRAHESVNSTGMHANSRAKAAKESATESICVWLCNSLDFGSDIT